jgi:hypothetical protein
MIQACAMKVLISAALGLMLLCGISLPSLATVVIWTLDGVRFDDGTSATGWFQYDASKNFVADWDIQSPGHHNRGGFIQNGDFEGPPRPCEVYIKCDFAASRRDDVDAPPGTQSFFFTECPGSCNPSAARELLLYATKALTDQGGNVPLLLADSPLLPLDGASRFYCCYSDPTAYMIAGALIAAPVPEPAEALSLALGLATLLRLSLRRSGARRVSAVMVRTFTKQV